MEPHEDPESRVGEGAAQRNADDGRSSRGAAVGGRGSGSGSGFGAGGRGSGGAHGGFGRDFGRGRGDSVGRGPGDNEGSRPVVGKRTRVESQNAGSEMVSGIKRVNANVSGPALSTRLTTEDVNVERNIFGAIAAVDTKDPRGSKNFSMPSLTETGATDVILNPSQRDGWNSVADVTRKLVEQGHDRIKMTIKPLARRPAPFSVGKYGRKPVPNNPEVPFGERRRVVELDDDAPSELIHCEACRANSHETKHCPIPTHAGDTVADPLCNHSVRAREKGDKRHSFDSRKAARSDDLEWLYCPVLIDYEKGEVDGILARLFDALVIDRRHMPPIRVFKEEYCMIRITIDFSDRHCQGRMPDAMLGAWPYTKQDALKYKDDLQRFDLVGWLNMPIGQLEEMDFQKIKRQYRDGRIPKQIYWQRLWNSKKETGGSSDGTRDTARAVSGKATAEPETAMDKATQAVLEEYAKIDGTRDETGKPSDIESGGQGDTVMGGVGEDEQGAMGNDGGSLDGAAPTFAATASMVAAEFGDEFDWDDT
ncbi:hypothetical protein SLS53_001529 [Cytospora paraplurivora]|uniref:Uncharacterized protein n=1 Tax=Cytospora paraplurivora TaxID=2898453 RepID=A0AAN9YKB1_9PEZI